MEGLKQEIDKDLARKINKANPSNKDLADILKHVVDNMWSEERLADYIYRVHHSLCEKCSRVNSAAGDGAKSETPASNMSIKMIALISSLVAAVVTLAGVVAKLAIGGV